MEKSKEVRPVPSVFAIAAIFIAVSVVGGSVYFTAREKPSELVEKAVPAETPASRKYKVVIEAEVEIDEEAKRGGPELSFGTQTLYLRGGKIKLLQFFAEPAQPLEKGPLEHGKTVH